MTERPALSSSKEKLRNLYNSPNYSQGSEQQLSHWSDGLLTSFCHYGVLVCTTSFTTLAMLVRPPPQHENSYCETQALKPPPLHLAENVGWATPHGNHLNRMQLSYVSLSRMGRKFFAFTHQVAPVWFYKHTWASRKARTSRLEQPACGPGHIYSSHLQVSSCLKTSLLHLFNQGLWNYVLSAAVEKWIFFHAWFLLQQGSRGCPCRSKSLLRHLPKQRSPFGRAAHCNRTVMPSTSGHSTAALQHCSAGSWERRGEK